MDKVKETLSLVLRFCSLVYCFLANPRWFDGDFPCQFLDLCRLKPAGEPPSPRAAHAAAAVGTMVVFQVIY